MMEFNYLPIKKVFYGFNANKEIFKVVNEGDFIYILTGKNTSKTSEFIDIISSLENKRVNYEILPYVSQHSPIDEVNEADAAIHKDDGKFVLLAYGGGAVIDASKILKGRKHPISLLAIPTTLSASEFSHIAGYTENHEKKGIRDKSLTPDYIILDPKNTISTPIDIYFSSGIRAIDHAIESALDLNVYDPRLYFSVSSYTILRNNLTDDSPYGRLMSQIGAWMSYMNVYDAPMGVSHNIGKIIGASFNIPHGITSCLTLPHIISYYRESGKLNSFLKILYGTEDYDRLRMEIESILKNTGLNKSMRHFGINEKVLEEIYKKLKINDENLLPYLMEML